jgi:hypothetical protein
MHWFSSSVTILVHIILVRSELAGYDGEGELIKETHYHISNDKKDDYFFVQHCLMLHWEGLIAAGIRSSEHWIFIDGCTGQFKRARTMYLVAHYLGLIGGGEGAV